MKDNWHLILGLFLAAISGIYIYNYVSQAQERGQVVIASQDIRGGTLITESQVELTAIHAEAIHPNAIRSLSQAIGKYSTHDVFKGEQLLSNNLAEHQRDRAFLSIKGNARAILIPAELSHAVGGLVQPGDRLDLIFVGSDKKLGTNISRVLAENVLVLDVRNDKGSSWDGKSDRLAGVVIAVTPEESERIAFALEWGEVYLTLRGYGAQDVKTTGITLENFFAQP